MVTNEAQLDDLLSKPSAADIAAMQELSGDLMILGVGGKMGPTLALRAKRASDAGGVNRRIMGVSRFTSAAARKVLQDGGVEAIFADLLNREAVDKLPEAPNLVYMAGRKFGSVESPALTWAMNAWLPGLIAERFHSSRIVAFSSGNV